MIRFQRLEFRNRRSEWIFLLLLILTGLLFSLLIGYLVGYLIWGETAAHAIASSSGGGNDANAVGFLKTVQLINHAGTFLVPALIFHYLVKQPSHWSLPHHARTGLWWMVIIAGINFTISPLVSFSQEINQLMHLPESFSAIETWMKGVEERANMLTESFLTNTTAGGLVANIFIMALLPALGEELLFRGIIQPKLALLFKNNHWGVLVTALLFSAMHLQFYGFIPRFLLGLLFGYFFLWTRNLWTAVWAHLLNNGTAVVIAYLADRKMTEIDYQDFGQTNTTLLIISTVITACLIVALFKLSAKQPTQST